MLPSIKAVPFPVLALVEKNSEVLNTMDTEVGAQIMGINHTKATRNKSVTLRVTKLAASASLQILPLLLSRVHFERFAVARFFAKNKTGNTPRGSRKLVFSCLIPLF